MATSEQQLITWSRQLSTTEDNTNVQRDSDIDIVVIHNDHYFPNLFQLNEEQKKIFHAKNPESSP